jgi:hypothetical protein
MRSSRSGAGTTGVELTKVTSDGITIRVDGRELSLPYDLFPWFRDASRSQLANIQRPSEDELSWPDLDVDLELDSILHPERYPLIFDPPAWYIEKYRSTSADS